MQPLQGLLRALEVLRTQRLSMQRLTIRKQLDYDHCRQGIRANAIAPSAIQTPMNQADFDGENG